MEFAGALIWKLLLAALAGVLYVFYRFRTKKCTKCGKALRGQKKCAQCGYEDDTSWSKPFYER
jgi:hypothetical protein